MFVAAHVPVGGYQADACIFAPLRPGRDLGRVRARILGLEPQCDAAVEQRNRTLIFGGELARLYLARDAADQQALGVARLEPFERAVDPPRAAGEHDDPVGFLRSRSEEHTSELQSLMRNSYAV